MVVLLAFLVIFSAGDRLISFAVVVIKAVSLRVFFFFFLMYLPRPTSLPVIVAGFRAEGGKLQFGAASVGRGKPL